MSSVPVTLPPPSDTAILPPAAWWVHGWHHCGVPGLNTDATVKNPAACLPLYVFSLFLKKYVFCACMCARFQTPERGLKMPLHPREEAVGSESQHICDWSDVLLQLYTYLYICIHLIFLFISSFVPLFLSVELIFAHAYHFSSLSSPLSVLQLCFLHTSSLSQSTPIPFSLFYSQYRRYLSLSLHLLSHRGEDKGGWDDLCLIQPLHWAPLIFSLVKCHRRVIVIKSYITGCWNVTLGDVTDLLCPKPQCFFPSLPHSGGKRNRFAL